MPQDNAHCKLIFDIKYIFLEQSADLLRILKHLFLNLRNERNSIYNQFNL